MELRTATDREIASQPQMWARGLEFTDRVRDLLIAPGERVLAIGCGTSAFVSQVYAHLRENAGFGETDWALASEMPTRRRYDRVIAITRSATTTEVVDALAALAPGARRIGVIAVPGQRIDDYLDDRILLDWADETSVVQTRFPTTLITMIRAAVGLDVSASIAQCEAAVVDPLPVVASDFDHLVFLGTGWTLGLAHEAALKTRESAQAWAESYPAMDYRHGPIAVAGPRSLVWMFGEPPAGLVDDVRATGATVVTDSLDPLVQLVRAQRLGVDLADSRGLNPDTPRALSRSVVLTTGN